MVARGGTSFAAALTLLRSEIAANIKQLKADGFVVHRPAVFFISDGEPTDRTDVWQTAFRELISDPVAAIERMYRSFGIEATPEASARMRAWIAANPQGKHGGHKYTLEQFGLAEGEIRERFARYAERWNSRAEIPYRFILPCSVV